MAARLELVAVVMRMAPAVDRVRRSEFRGFQGLGLGFRVQGSGFRGLGLSGFRAFRVWGLGLSGLGFQGLGVSIRL